MPYKQKCSPGFHSMRSPCIDGKTSSRLDLHFAAIENDQNVVAKIIKKQNFEVNLRDSDGFTPVMSAVLFGSVEALKVLLDDERVVIQIDDLTNILAKFDENRHDDDLDEVKMMMCIKLYREAFVTRKMRMKDEKGGESKRISKMISSENIESLGARKRALSLFSSPKPSINKNHSISELEDVGDDESIISSSSSEGSTKSFEGSTKSMPLTRMDFASIKTSSTRLRRSKTLGPTNDYKRTYSVDSFERPAPKSLIISNFPLVTLSLSTSESLSENMPTITRSCVSASAIKMIPIQEAANSSIESVDDDVFIGADPKDEQLKEINKLADAIEAHKREQDEFSLKQSREQNILIQKQKRLDDFKTNNEKRLAKLTSEKTALLEWLEKINSDEKSLLEENSGINFQLSKLSERRAMLELSLEKERKVIDNKHKTLVEQHRKLSDSYENSVENSVENTNTFENFIENTKTFADTPGPERSR